MLTFTAGVNSEFPFKLLQYILLEFVLEFVIANSTRCFFSTLSSVCGTKVSAKTEAGCETFLFLLLPSPVGVTTVSRHICGQGYFRSVRKQTLANTANKQTHQNIKYYVTACIFPSVQDEKEEKTTVS